MYHANPPTTCDLCKVKLADTFIDGKTSYGPWGNLCPACHARHGVGLGTGKGQRYQRQPDGRWLKTQG